MKISIVQPDTVWEDKMSNFIKLEELVSSVDTDTDIIILPEMFNTGFSMNPGKVGEKKDHLRMIG